MATALVAQPVAQHWPEVKRQLEKKATFEQVRHAADCLPGPTALRAAALLKPVHLLPCRRCSSA